MKAIRLKCYFPTFGNVKMLQRSPTASSYITHMGRQFRTRQQHMNSSGFGQRKSITPPALPTPDASHTVVSARVLLKPIGFTLGFATGTYVSMAIWEYESARSRIIRTMQAPLKWIKPSQNTSLSLANIKQWWRTLSDSDRLLIPICTINAIIYLLWRVPRLQPTMMKYFCANPASKAVCWPMFLSTFSHYSLLHLVANMFVLSSFIHPAVNLLGKEQFLGLYLSAGVISSLTSHMYKVAKGVGAPSLGASGAIMAIVAIFCSRHPDTELSLIFLPFFTFSASLGLYTLMGVDAAGCILGWKFFDHAAHLGGATFGLAWFYMGREYIWNKRKYIVNEWHKVRELTAKKGRN